MQPKLPGQGFDDHEYHRDLVFEAGPFTLYVDLVCDRVTVTGPAAKELTKQEVDRIASGFTYAAMRLEAALFTGFRRNLDIPRYVSDQLADYTINLTRAGLLPPGSRLPWVSELAAATRVSRWSVNRAMAALEQRGHIVRRGRAFYVTGHEESPGGGR